MNSHKSVLFVSYDGMTDPLGQSQVIPYLTGLAREGRKIVILSCEKEESLRKLGSSIQALLDQYNIDWYHVGYHNRFSVLSTLYTVFKLRSKSKELYHKYKFNLVHCRSYIPAFIGIFFKRKYGCKFIFDMRGFWPDEKVEGGSWNLKNPLYRMIYRFFKRKELLFFNTADHVISLTEAGKKELWSWSGIKSQPLPVTVIPCCADFKVFDYSSVSDITKEAMRTRLGIGKDVFVLHYLGSIGGSYMADEMLQFYKLLLKQKPDVVFLINTLSSESYIKERAALLNIDTGRIIVRPAQRAEVPMYMAISDLAVFFIKPTYSKKASSPTKQAEILGMGIPIITNTGIGDSDVILSPDIGCLLNTFSAAEMETAIGRIGDLIKTPKERIRKAGLDHYSLEIGINNYNLVYQEMLG